MQLNRGQIDKTNVKSKHFSDEFVIQDGNFNLFATGTPGVDFLFIGS
jgi:hypothetical protein